MTHLPTTPRQPRRIQRRRKKGWRLPEGAVYVGRPTKWGNPYTHVNPGVAVRAFRKILEGDMRYIHGVKLARGALAMDKERARLLRLRLPQLRGKDLACWCRLCERHKDGLPLGEYCKDCEPCHADVLLELANR